MIAAVCRVYQQLGPLSAVYRRSVGVIAWPCCIQLGRAISTITCAIVTTGGRLAGSLPGHLMFCIAIAASSCSAECERLESRRSAERERLVRMIDTYCAKHGNYPASLEDTGRVPDPTLFHFWCDIVGPNREPIGFSLAHGGILLHHDWEYYYHKREWFHTASQ